MRARNAAGKEIINKSIINRVSGYEKGLVKCIMERHDQGKAIGNASEMYQEMC
jgi:hypothetical protein